MKTGVFSEYENQFLIENYKTMTYKDIAAVLDRKEQAVNNRLRKLGLIKVNKSQWTDPEIEKLKLNYSTCSIIQNLFQYRTVQSIHYKAFELGLNRDIKNKYEVNHDYFDTFTPNMAYILGMICADGNICSTANRVTITLHRNDLYMLENIRNEIGSTRPIASSNTSNCNMLVFTSEKIVKRLNSFGIYPSKSLTIEWIDSIPAEYLRYFVLGYIDGDGCITHFSRKRPNNKYKKVEQVLEVSLLGTENFLVGMSTAINKIIGIKIMKTSKPKGFINGKEFRNISKIRFTGSTAVKLLDWLYNDFDFYLTRKNNKYNEFLNLTKAMDSI